ncbi:alpha/beta hydrolase [Planococcus sp. N028]|uniref:Alpha/beta hydrolase n=1 Tax=Planococcus shixiaomingii TaxID=3058393 RepID=A0ABT8MXT3_9BACL|nr:alpha/beta hydrolase [Planococcus sp. N028]MDN7240248.1 alpha/beta hydrolase [Planococcus sp. N028]
MILHTEVFGEGDPIVFLHTGLQTSLTDFGYQKDYFADAFQVVLPDLRGHGKSITDNFLNYFEGAAADLDETLDHLGILSAHIVGCSLGALVGLFFAKTYTKKVKSLTLSGVLAEKPANWEELNQAEADQEKHLLQNEQATGYFDQLHQSDWRKFIAMGKDPNWYPFHETTSLIGIKAPVLYLVGEENSSETKGSLLYPAIGENVHVGIIPFAGHLVHDEQPEIYSKIVECFPGKIG